CITEVMAGFGGDPRVAGGRVGPEIDRHVPIAVGGVEVTNDGVGSRALLSQRRIERYRAIAGAAGAYAAGAGSRAAATATAGVGSRPRRWRAATFGLRAAVRVAASRRGASGGGGGPRVAGDAGGGAPGRRAGRARCAASRP